MTKDPLLTIPLAAALLGVSRPCLASREKRGLIKFERTVGRLTWRKVRLSEVCRHAGFDPEGDDEMERWREGLAAELAYRKRRTAGTSTPTREGGK